MTLDGSKTVVALFQAPSVGVQVTKQPGGSALLATLTARPGCGNIDHIQFGDPGQSFTNAQVSITHSAGGPTGQSSVFTYTPPPGTTSVSLAINRTVASGGVTVSPIHFFDGCGEWKTFIGAGANAFN